MLRTQHGLIAAMLLAGIAAGCGGPVKEEMIEVKKQDPMAQVKASTITLSRIVLGRRCITKLETFSPLNERPKSGGSETMFLSQSPYCTTKGLSKPRRSTSC